MNSGTFGVVLLLLLLSISISVCDIGVGEIFGKGGLESMSEVRIFAATAEDMFVMPYRIEFALENHHKALISLVESVDKMLERIAVLNAHTSGRYATVHSNMTAIASLLPSNWQENMSTIQNLISPSNMSIQLLLSADSHDPESKTENRLLNGIETQSMRDGDRDRDKSKDEIASYESINQLIVHINRDWAVFGSDVRRRLYFEALIPVLLRHSPVSRARATRVLIPGAGLGRLAIEIAALGYSVEANECSSTMVCAMHSIFNELLPTRQQKPLYPFLQNAFQDDWSLDSRSIVAQIPYIDDSDALSDAFTNQRGLAGSLSIQLGDFVSVYGHHIDRAARFEVVLTCFFIDTGPNILKYIETIRHVLTDNGIWINLGPLHYHIRQAVPYSFAHLLDVIALSGFTMLENRKVDAPYCGEDLYSMKPEVYRVPLSVFRKTALPDVPRTDEEMRPPFSHKEYVLRR